MLRRCAFLAFLVCVLSDSYAWCSEGNSLQLGIQCFNNRQYVQAIDLLSKAQANQAQAPRALYYRALSELKLGRTVAAADTFRALVAISPSSHEAHLAQQFLAAQRPTAAGSPLQTASLPKHVRIPYRDSRDGWLHVNATVNGKKVDMVWDTGASNCSVPLSLIETLPKGAKSTSVETPGGAQPAWLAPISIECGDLKRVALTSIMDGTAVLGQSFFRDYVVEVNKKQRLIYLDYVGTADGAKRPRAVSKFQLPFERESGILLVEMTVDGEKLKAYFDTGCAARGIAMPRTLANTMPKTVDIALGPITRRAVKVTVADGLSRPLVGPAIFGDRDYKIDPVHQVIDFEYVQE